MAYESRLTKYCRYRYIDRNQLQVMFRFQGRPISQIWSLSKVSESNSFRANQSHSEPFRTNPKNVLKFVQCKSVKNQFDSFRLNSRFQSESVRALIDPSRIEYTWFGLKGNKSDWFLTDLHRTRFKMFGTIRKKILKLLFEF